jgi:hypothetical protein
MKEGKMEKNRTPVGKALYLELQKGTGAYQIIFVPGYRDPRDGERKLPVVLKRQVSASSPRKQWKIATTWGYGASDLRKTISSLSRQDAVGTMFTNSLNSIMSQLFHQGWVVNKRPLAVEVSEEDAMKVHDGKTPPALIRRIDKARIELGYSENYYNTPIATISV